MTLCDKCFSERMTVYRDPVTRKESRDMVYCVTCGHVQSLFLTQAEKGWKKIVVAILSSRNIIADNYTGTLVAKMTQGELRQIGSVSFRQE